jgi:hypothetical protein
VEETTPTPENNRVPRRFGQLLGLVVPEDFDAPLTDSEFADGAEEDASNQ